MGSNGDLVKGLYDAFAKGDVPAVLGAFDPRIEWREAEGFLYADGNPYTGPQAVAEGVFQQIVSDVEGFQLIPKNIFDAGQAVVVEGRYKGRIAATCGPSWGKPAAESAVDSLCLPKLIPR